MTNPFYCSVSQLRIKRKGKTLGREDLDELTTRELKKFLVEMHGHPVRFENLANGEIRFDFRGSDHNQRYKARAPAREILEGLCRLASFYDPPSQQFYF